MNAPDLAEIFVRLKAPDEAPSDAVAFAAAPIPGTAHRLARDAHNQPALLLALDEEDALHQAPIVLQHIAVRHGVRCRIRREGGDVEQGKFSIVQCIGGDPALHLHFLRAAGSAVLALGGSPSVDQLSSSIATLVKLFRATTAEPRKKIQGLWAELLVIARAKDPGPLIAAWHAAPEDLYDFAEGPARIEVKSTAGRTRRHYFRLEQLHPAASAIVLVASVMVEQSSGGDSAHDLLLEIRERTKASAELLLKLESVVATALGSDWPAAMSARFDRQLAQSSIEFFDARSIPSPPAELPAGVTDVRFRSTLDGLAPTQIDVDAHALFRAAAPRTR